MKKIILIALIAFTLAISGCINPPPSPFCGNNVCEAGKNSTNCPQDCGLPPGETFNGDGTFTIKAGDSIVPDEGFRVKIDSITQSNYPVLSFTVVSKEGNVLVTRQDNLPIGFTLIHALFQKSHIDGIKPGAFNIKNSQNSANSMTVSIDSCPLLVGQKAIGEKKILFVLAYTEKIKGEIQNNSERVKNIYEPVFSDIKNYLKVKQNKLIGKEIFGLDFTVSTPIIVPSEADYSAATRRDTDKKILEYIRNQTSIEPSDFDYIVLRLYISSEEQPITQNPYASIVAVNITGRIPEEPIDWQDENIFYSNIKPYYTSVLVHEILHHFGMSDEIAYNAGYGLGGVFYIGKDFDGSQELIVPGPNNPKYKNVADIQNEAQRILGNMFFVGQFQEINELMAQELGWKDINNNGIMDVLEACEQTCVIEENARINRDLAGMEAFDFCSKK
ncbi:hypothetical protein HZB88_00365 [archaeon]|nr:hypothetical protein [archaeon]